jgi:hypothetical protein
MKLILYSCFVLLFAFASCKKDSTQIAVYQDDLTTDKQTWNVDSSSNGYRKFDQGHYLITVDTINELFYSLAPYYTINYPYSVQVDGTFELLNSNGIGAVGIIFNHIDANNYSRADVWTNGTYAIVTKTNGTFTTNISSTYSSVINPLSGSENTIKVIQNASTLELLINNTSVATYPISLPASNCSSGVVALTDPNPYYTPVTGWFNNFILSKN